MSLPPNIKSERNHESISPQFGTMKRVIFILMALFCLTPWASPPCSLTIGMLLALFFENPYPKLSKHIASILLRTCVVLLGFGMNLSVVLQAGADGMIFAAGSIALTLLLGAVIGRWLLIDSVTSVLISSGTAICGGSAIAAVGSVIGAEEAEMSVAIGTVFLLNALALYLFPILGYSLHLTQNQFGLWSGIAIHDISSVVGASTGYGLDALQVATAVKLSRTLWIVPLALGAAYVFRKEHTKNRSSSGIQIPWFIGLFILASIMRSYLPGVAELSPTVSHAASIGFTLTLFLIGTSLSRKTLRTVGWKPLLQGVLLWAFISCSSLIAILYFANERL